MLHESHEVEGHKEECTGGFDVEVARPEWVYHSDRNGC
jgi:hypothetical protein